MIADLSIVKYTLASGTLSLVKLTRDELFLQHDTTWAVWSTARNQHRIFSGLRYLPAAT